MSRDKARRAGEKGVKRGKGSMRSALRRSGVRRRLLKSERGHGSSLRTRLPSPPLPASPPPARPAGARRLPASGRRHVPATVSPDGPGRDLRRLGLGLREAQGPPARRAAAARRRLGRGPRAGAGAGARGEAGGRAEGRGPRAVPSGPRPRGAASGRASAAAGAAPRSLVSTDSDAAPLQALLQSHRQQPRPAAQDQGAATEDEGGREPGAPPPASPRHGAPGWSSPAPNGPHPRRGMPAAGLRKTPPSLTSRQQPDVVGGLSGCGWRSSLSSGTVPSPSGC